MGNDTILKLTSTIEEQRISSYAKKALFEIAIDPHGIEQNAAPGLVASILGLSLEQANQAIIELLGKNLLISREGNEETRIFANYDTLNIDSNNQGELLSRQEVFDNLHEAHSELSMRTLDDFFLNSEGTIYLGCEVTSHHTFRKLQTRAATGKQTIFLMPKKRDVKPTRKIHYNEIIAEWIGFIKEGPACLKKNIRIRITSRPFPQLFTSGLSSDVARFDLYFFSSNTTRRGSILQVKKGSSLYELIFESYKNAIISSYPLWRLWFNEAFLCWIEKIAFPIILFFVGIICYKINNPIALFFSALAVGIFVNYIWEKIGMIPWRKIDLFKK